MCRLGRSCEGCCAVCPFGWGCGCELSCLMRQLVWLMHGFGDGRAARMSRLWGMWAAIGRRLLVDRSSDP